MIWNFFIRRRVLTLVLFLASGIFGVFAYVQMPVREIPDIDFPVVSVNVVLPGADPQVIETEIIEPLETEINTLEGLKELSSTAREQVAVITAEFELWRDIDVATQDVRDAVQRAVRELPDDVEAPIVRKLDPDAQPIMWVTLTGDERWDPVRMSEFVDQVLKERLENVRGVGQVLIGGEQAFAVRVQLDPEAMAAHGVTPSDVVDAIGRNNVDIPAGRIESRTREFLVQVQGRFSAAEPINDIIVAWDVGGPVRVRDVGRAVPGVQNARQLARFKGEPSVGLGIIKQSDANTVQVADAVRERLADLGEDFPPGLAHAVATDNSIFVRDNLRDLLMTVVVATVLVVLVVLLFLRSLPGTVIASLAIPISLLLGLAVTEALGFSLNTLTMLAFILAIGIVVDDAIVVLESCYRHLEEGAEREPAARVGTTEVAFAAIANTLSLAAVFIPIAFTEGLIGRFFYEFGVTVAVTVFASTFVALSLTPMLCARMLKLPGQGRLARSADRAVGVLERGFRWLFARAFRRRWWTAAAGLLAAVLGGFFFSRLSTEFIPDVDREGFMITFEVPEGATLSETDAFARSIEGILRDVPQVEHQFLALGLSQGGPGEANTGMVFVHLTPRGEREVHQSEVMERVRQRLNAIPMGTAQVLEGGGPTGGGAPIQIALQGTDLDSLALQKDELMEWMRAQPELVGVDANIELASPELEVAIDRDRAAELGLSVTDISNALRVLLGEPDISEIEREAERYDVITEIVGAGEMVPADLGRIQLRNREGRLVPLSNVVTWTETVGPSEIHHYDRLRSVTVSASPRQGLPLGDALGKVENYLKSRSDVFDYRIVGQAQDFEESFAYLTVAVALALVFVYLVLAAQFESFLHPFTILLSVPLAAVGAAGALWAFGMTLNIFSFIGLIMLFGMATKNAILLIDYTNLLIDRGREVHEAAREAAHVRFRPVLMTTMSTVLGILPIAVGIGAGGEARMPLGVAVVVGLLATTFLTLLVVPVVFTLLDDARVSLARRWRRREAT